jgi:hypothetical protein
MISYNHFLYPFDFLYIPYQQTHKKSFPAMSTTAFMLSLKASVKLLEKSQNYI